MIVGGASEVLCFLLDSFHLNQKLELSLGGVGDPLGLWIVLITSLEDFDSLKRSSGSALEISQLCRGGYHSLEESFRVAEAVLIIAPNLVLLVMLEIGGASGNVTFLGFLGMSSPEIVGWRFTDFQGVAGSGFNSSLGR
jgi:hypothetical protein